MSRSSSSESESPSRLSRSELELVTIGIPSLTTLRLDDCELAGSVVSEDVDKNEVLMALGFC